MMLHDADDDNNVIDDNEEEEELRRRYLLGSNSNDNEYHNIEHLNRARLPENREVNQAGHPNTYNFLIIIKLLL